jgi:hypothetical protein
MLAPTLLFLSTFVVVLALGLQQINVERRHIVAAALTSPVIGLATWVQVKLIAWPTTTADFLAYLVGGSAGIACSIWVHPHLLAFASRVRHGQLTRAAETLKRVGQQLALIRDRLDASRMAHQLADDEARVRITTACRAEGMGRLTWYDTQRVNVCIEDQESLDEAVCYLRLRRQLAVHPVQAHLVRPL